MSDPSPTDEPEIKSRLGLGSGTRHSLLTLLTTLLTRSPKPCNKRIASSTTARAAKKFKSTCKDGEMILGLVFCPDLLDRSLELASKRAREPILDEADCCDVVFMTFISPHLTPSFCSPELFSENDSREYSGIGLIRPALAAMHIADIGVLFTFTCNDSATKVYVSSGFKIKGKPGPISDGLLIEGPYEGDEIVELNDDDELIEVEIYEDGYEVPSVECPSHASIREGDCPKALMAIEFKTSNAVSRQTFSEVMRLKTLPGFKNRLLLPFVWPGVGTKKIRKSTKIIAQVCLPCSTLSMT